jgi:MYXO-CTERM domain-containing protein
VTPHTAKNTTCQVAIKSVFWLLVFLGAAAQTEADWSDDTSVESENCLSTCEQYVSCQGTCMSQVVSSASECQAVCDRDPGAFGECWNYGPCRYLLYCLCGAEYDDDCGQSGDDNDVSPTAARRGSDHHDRDGCRVASPGPDLPLFLAMIAIGLFALALGRTNRRSR